MTGESVCQPFIPAWWCRNPHAQTLWSRITRYRPRVALRRERIELPDGDFIDLDWGPTAAGPTVLVLHGLEGSSRSPYALGLLSALHKRGLQGVVMHFRGCSGTPNRLPRSYHSGETQDLAFIIGLLTQRLPTPLTLVGFSLGGNVLLKWLGEAGYEAPVSAAVAISVPFLLASSAARLNRGFSRLYQWKLVGDLRAKTRKKFSRLVAPIPLDRLNRLRSFHEFDHHVTAPLHGFADAADYYARSSSRQYLGGIRVPTLILHASDDPFMLPEVIPARHELSPSTRLELSSHGGHVGFVSGRWPWRPRYWLEERVAAFLLAQATARQA